MHALNKLKIFDMFGESITFENDSSRKFNTVSGGVFTIIFALFCLLLVLILGSDLYERKVATVTSSDELKDSASIYLNDLPLLFGFFDKNGLNMADPFEIIEVSVSIVTIKDSITVQYSNNFSPCSPIMFPDFEFAIEKMINESPYKFICYNSSESEYIKNNLGDSDSITYMIEISKCDSSVRKCHPDIDKIMSGFYSVIHYVNQYLNPRNYSDPLASSVESITQLLASGFTKYHYLKTAENTFISDDGWISEHLITREYNSFFSLSSDINTATSSQFNGKELLYSIALEATKVTNISFRTYMKLSDVFAQIGGLVTIVYYAFRALLSFYYSYKYTCLIKGIYLDAKSHSALSRIKLSGSIAFEAPHNSNHITPINPKEVQSIKIHEHTTYIKPSNNQSEFPIINVKESTAELQQQKSEHFLKYFVSMVLCCIHPKSKRRYKMEKLEVSNTMSLKTYVSLIKILVSNEYFKEKHLINH